MIATPRAVIGSLALLALMAVALFWVGGLVTRAGADGEPGSNAVASGPAFDPASVTPRAASGSVAEGGITISPDHNDLTIGPGFTMTETLTVTVPAEAGAAQADVYFLADNTGSMGSIISAVQTGASDIITGLPGGIDFAFGVGNYQDFMCDEPDQFVHQLSVGAGSPTNADAAQSAIGGWAAGGGCDSPEGQFYALDRIANDTNPLGGTIGWRPDSEKIVVWFGDCPAHDPIPMALSGLGYDITEGTVTADLSSAGIIVIAISTMTGCSGGLDDDPSTMSFDYSSGGGAAGQATRIAAATGGTHLTGIDSSTIVGAIIDEISTAVSEIDELMLVPSPSVAPFISSINPASYGPLSSEESHTLPFTVEWMGMPCGEPHGELHISGAINVVADGGVVARKTVEITVPPCGEPPVGPMCNGLAATIIGSDGDDILVGTMGPDVVVGMNGNDILRGLAGDDLLCGGPGNDILMGNMGMDWLDGGDGNDILGGGMGDDTLYGRGGHDILMGAQGDDLLDGGPGDDILRGGGSDASSVEVAASAGDKLNGGAGNDLCVGSAGQNCE